jgi:probable F420-dependent oxidoreductase
MSMSRDGVELAFGASLSWSSGRADLIATATAAEEAGFDVLTAADHLGTVTPFQVLAVAAAVTTRIRLRTYTLDSYFWNPALLAREVATLDRLSGGRFELGLGAGHMRHEHEDAGLPFPPIRERAAFMAALLDDVRARLSPCGSPGARESADESAGGPADGSDDDEKRGRPVLAAVQRPVPILVGAWGSAGLAVGVRAAESIGLTGMVQIPGERAGTFRIASSAETDDKLAELRSLPRDLPEPPVLDALLQQVVVDRDPEEAAMDLVKEVDGRLTVEELLDTPFFLYAASVEDAAAELARRAQRWGITSWCTHGPSVPAMAEVVRFVR